MSRPTQINFLALAFHQAGQSTGEAHQTFQNAQQHFQQYQRENGEQPINDGAEVARVKKDLHASNEQLAQIAADLETIAAALAEARTTTADDIDTLNTNLQYYDIQIADYLAQEQHGHDCDAQITAGLPRPGAPNAPRTQPTQVGGKWGNVGDGIAGAAGAANAPWLRAELPHSAWRSLFG